MEKIEKLTNNEGGDDYSDCYPADCQPDVCIPSCEENYRNDSKKSNPSTPKGSA